MLNSLDVDRECLVEITKRMAEEIIAVALILIDKGIVTEEEYVKYQKQAEEIVGNTFKF